MNYNNKTTCQEPYPTDPKLFVDAFLTRVVELDTILVKFNENSIPVFSDYIGIYRLEEPQIQYMPKELLIQLVDKTITVFAGIEKPTLDEVFKEIDIFHDIYHLIIVGLFNSFHAICNFYRTEVSNYFIFLNFSNAINALADAWIVKCYYDPELFAMASESLKKAVDDLINDVYRDEPFPSLYIPKPTNEPVHFPPPDPVEMDDHRHYYFNNKGIRSLDWPIFESNTIENKLGNSRVLTPNHISHLWGYSEVVCQKKLLTESQLTRMPRFALYPFYRCIFPFIDRLFKLGDEYERRSLRMPPSVIDFGDVVEGDVIMKNMKSVLMYAPREYFREECLHSKYLQLINIAIEASLDRICETITMDYKANVVKIANMFKKQFQTFHSKLTETPIGTMRSYEAEINAIVDPDIGCTFTKLWHIIVKNEIEILSNIDQTKPNRNPFDKLSLSITRSIIATLEPNNKQLSSEFRSINQKISNIPKAVSKEMEDPLSLLLKKNGATTEEIDEVLGSNDPFGCFDQVRNKAHRAQLIAFAKYTQEHPITRPSSSKKYRERGQGTLSATIKQFMDEQGSKWNKIPAAWHNTQEDLKCFESAIRNQMGKENDPFNYNNS